MELLYIGTISSVKGLDGSVILSDIPKGIKKVPLGVNIYIGFSEKFAKKYTLTKWIKLAHHSLIAMQEITTPESAEQFKEQGAFIEKDVLKKNAGNKIDNELIGFKAYDVETNELLGEVSDLWFMPAGEVWVITGKNCEYTVPAVEAFITKYDEKNRKFKVKLIEGMKNLNSNEEEIAPDDIDDIEDLDEIEDKDE